MFFAQKVVSLHRFLRKLALFNVTASFPKYIEQKN